LLRQLTGRLAQLIPEPNRTRDIAMFLLYFGYRVTAAELARLYHLGTKTVESKLLRLSRLARAIALKSRRVPMQLYLVLW